MSRTGFVFHDLTVGQLSHDCLSAAGDRVRDDPTLEVTFFYEELSLSCLQPLVALMPVAHLAGFAGNLVATSLQTASKVLRCVSARRRVFWVQDLEWLGQAVEWRTLQGLYGNPALELLARGESHAEVLGRCWNREVAVARNFEEVMRWLG